MNSSLGTVGRLYFWYQSPPKLILYSYYVVFQALNISPVALLIERYMLLTVDVLGKDGKGNPSEHDGGVPPGQCTNPALTELSA